ncbi:MAG TPA: sporulation protein YqfD [Clostridiales bacterium]|jgi:similar to stage IV sporulation protein|nr:sporulation protein YqfD [Clostridiales bacterium]
MKLVYFFCGGMKLGAEREDTERILNLCLKYGIIYKDLKLGPGSITLECSMYTAELLRLACAERGISLWVVEKYGLPVILRRYKRRVGVLVGLILAAVLVFLSERFVWDIRITGCENIEENDVILQLGEQNFRIGSYIPTLDVDVIENRFLINSEDIAWISINLRGSVAYVEIREKTKKPEPKNHVPANLIAARDGQIEAIEATSGKPVVKVGDHVRQGDLLVSGVYDSSVWGYRYTRAEGAVYARTSREIHVEIPLEYEVKRYSGEEHTETALIFFSKEIKLYRNTGFLSGTYDTICSVEDICLFDGTRLPLSLARTVYRWYTKETATRSAGQAAELAYAELDRQIAELTLGGAQLLRKSISWLLTENSYRLDCNLTLIENIALTSEFEVVE